MANFKNDILEMVGNEVIERISVGSFGYNWDKLDSGLDEKGFPREMYNKLYYWDEVSEYLNYEYSTDYGREDCHPIHLWTRNRVIFVVCYDGKTWLGTVPRFPVEDIVGMFGG